MSRKRTSGYQLPRGSALFLAVGGAIGCTAYPTLKPMDLDCTVESAYALHSVDTFDTVGSANLWTSGDTTTADVSVAVDALTDGSRCGSTAALHIHSFHNNDWGSLFGFNNFGPRDESASEGMSFWARAPGNTTKGFTMLLGDPNTTCLGTVGADGLCQTPPGNCKTYQTADGGTMTTTVVDPATGMAISGSTTNAPPPDACGNGYTIVEVVTTDWRYYTIPFGQFQQAATPNRVPNSALTQVGSAPGTKLLTSALLSLTLRMPKEAVMELWIDNLSFYRKKTPGAVSDGGTDAARM